MWQLQVLEGAELALRVWLGGSVGAFVVYAHVESVGMMFATIVRAIN